MEEYRDIYGYEGLYQVSNLGNIKSLKRKFVIRDKVLVPRNTRYGYFDVNLSKNGVNKTFRIHKLVANAFLCKGVDMDGMVVDHINNIKTDNKLSNLQIITARENSSKDQKNRTSKYIGVHWNTKNSKWISSIAINGKGVYLGSFDCEYSASLVYQKKLNEINGSRRE